MFIENDDEKKAQINTPQQANQSIGAGGGAAGTVGNPSTINPVESNKPEQKFATVQDYLGANKTQGEQLGQQFKGKLDTKLGEDKGAIDTSANQVNQGITANTVNYDSGLVNSALKDPTKVANNDDQLKSFLGQWNADYAGPASFESTSNFDTANKAASDAATKAAQVGDAGGRKQILQDEFGVYGQGNKGLDQTLLQNSGTFGAIQDTGKQFASIPDYLKAQSQGINQAATKAADTAAQTQKNTRDNFANSFNNFQTDLTSRATANQATATAAVNKVKQDLASGDLTKVQNDLNTSKIDPATKSSIQSYLATLNQQYGTKPDLTNYYTYNPATDVNPTTVATKADFAKAAALQKLTGQDYSGVLNPADISKADTWNNVSSGLQGASLQQYLKGSVGQQDKELFAKTSLPELTSKMNIPDLTDPKNSGNVTLGTKAANTLIESAKRSGVSKEKLDELYHMAAVAFVRSLGGDSQGSGQRPRTDSASAGLRTLVNTLGTYLYGKPQY